MGATRLIQRSEARTGAARLARLIARVGDRVAFGLLAAAAWICPVEPPRLAYLPVLATRPRPRHRRAV
jgi:hypothetical protein